MDSKAFQILEAQPVSTESLRSVAEANQIQEPGATQPFTMGFVAPFGGELVEDISGVGKVVAVKTISRVLPSSVVKKAHEELIATFEEQQGFRAGRETRKELKERVIQELLPKAFLAESTVQLLFTPDTLFVGCSSDGKRSSVLEFILSAFNRAGLGDELSIRFVEFKRPVSEKLTAWAKGEGDDDAIDDLLNPFDVGASFRAETSYSSVLSGKNENLSDFQHQLDGSRRITELELSMDGISFRVDTALRLKSIRWPKHFKDEARDRLGEENSTISRQQVNAYIIGKALRSLKTNLLTALEN